MRDAEIATGVIKASVLAGPVFLIAMAASAAAASNAPVTIQPAMALAALLLGIAVVPGAVLAVIPVLLGTATLAALGRGNAGLRHPAVWALAGAAMTAPWLPWPDRTAADAFAVTGAVCALLARSGVHWHDAPVAAGTTDPAVRPAPPRLRPRRMTAKRDTP